MGKSYIVMWTDDENDTDIEFFNSEQDCDKRCIELLKFEYKIDFAGHFTRQFKYEAVNRVIEWRRAGYINND